MKTVDDRGRIRTSALTDDELRAEAVSTAERTKTDLLPYAAILVGSDSITPSAGMRIQVVWVQVIPNPDNTTANAVTVGFDGGTKLYEVYAVGRSAVFLGDPDQNLDIVLANAEPVSVNIHYREV